MRAEHAAPGRMAACLLGLLGLGVLMWVWDSGLFAGLRAARASTAQQWWGVAAYWLGLGGVQMAVLGLLALAAWAWRRRADLAVTALVAVLAVAVAGGLTQVIKHLVGRPRPRMNLSWNELVGPVWDSDLHSLPSGHAATSFALAMYLGLRFPRWILPLLVLAALISVGRVLSLSHYPSDVVIGAWLGLAVGWLADFIQRRREKGGGR